MLRIVEMEMSITNLQPRLKAPRATITKKERENPWELGMRCANKRRERGERMQTI